MFLVPSLPKDSFWHIAPRQTNVEKNPLNYRCAPNHGSPDYVACQEVLDFVAYGLRRCWLSPGQFSLWYKLKVDDISWLREYFLAAFERFVLAIYEEKVDESIFDWGYYQELMVGQDTDPDPESVALRWVPDSFDENSFSLRLDCEVVGMTKQTTRPDEDPPIWCSFDTLPNRAWVRLVLDYARSVNGLSDRVPNPELGDPQRWDALGVRQLFPQYVIDSGMAKARNAAQIPNLESWYMRQEKEGDTAPVRVPLDRKIVAR